MPVNLCVPVPAGVAPEHAAFATVGAIAMQGVRRAEVALGETACVIGLGLIGQLVVRLLVASGVQVVGLDTVGGPVPSGREGRRARLRRPRRRRRGPARGVLLERTGGLGADHVLLAAGGDSNGPVEMAARLARDRARIVDIGKTRLDLPWNAYYDKELDVRFSRSYGPGRYDDRYELEGIDYPAGYVRWTERRNLACFLDLLADGSVDVASLVSGVHPVDEAASASTTSSHRARCRASASCCPTGAPDDGRTPRPPPDDHDARARAGPARRRRPATTGAVRVGFIGAGNYAASMLLPHLREDARVELVVGRRPRRRCRRSTPSASSASARSRPTSTPCSTTTPSTPSSSSPGTTRTPASSAAPSNAASAVFVEKPLALTDGAARRHPRRRSRRPATTG